MAKMKITLMIATPPYDNKGAFTGARIALTSVMDEIETNVVLIEDGIYSGIADQEPISKTSTSEFLADFVESGGNLLVCKNCMKMRGIPGEMLIEGSEIIDLHRLVNEMADSDQTVFFGV